MRLLSRRWSDVQIGDLCERIFDGPFGSNLKSADYTETGVRVVRLENIGHLQFLSNAETYIPPLKYKGLFKHTLRAGDIIFSSFIDEKVRVCLIPNTIGTAINKADCFCLRINPQRALPTFVAYRLAAGQTYTDMKTLVHGATRPRINLRQLREYVISLPPLEEQSRVIERLDRVFARARASRERLEQVPKLLKQFREAILKAAASGGLTQEWRRARSEQLRWRPVTLSSVCTSITDGDHQAPPQAEAGVPFITIAAINDGRLHLERARRFVPETYYSGLKADRKPAAGDVLYSVTGSIGIPAMVDTTRPFVFQRHIAILKPDLAQISNRFLYYRLQASDIRTQAESVATGTAQLTIPLSELRAFSLDLPCRDEQDEIVRRLNGLFLLLETLDRRYRSAVELTEKLAPSVLSKAFRGELVSQDPADELTRKRLERVKAGQKRPESGFAGQVSGGVRGLGRRKKAIRERSGVELKR